MKLYEYEAKGILARYGIKIPEGRVVTDGDDIRSITKELGEKVAVKAQVLVGGRGKAGGIILVDKAEEAEIAVRRILSMEIKGLKVKKVLLEKALQIKDEYYLGITIDRRAKKVVGMGSVQGGVDIEEVAAKTPEKIGRVYIHPLLGLKDFTIRELCRKAGFPRETYRQIGEVFAALHRIFMETDATLLEINPLVVATDGGLMAVDAKLDLDDNALFRHTEFTVGRQMDEGHPLEVEAKRRGLTYVKLQGEVGVIGNGAGLVMATVDAIKEAGGSAANFLDIGGGAKAEVVKSAIELLLLDPEVKVILVNIFGGITRCDEVAKGILEALSGIETGIPFILRLKGTRAEEGQKMIANAGFIIKDTMKAAAAEAVALTKR